MAHGLTLANVLEGLQGVTQASDEYKALCPAHDDKNPSLSITEKNGKILLYCHAGCTQQAVMDALGIVQNVRQKPKKRIKKSLGPIVKVYQYTDADGQVLHETVRYNEPEKAFRQRRPDPDKPGQYIWSLTGIAPVLYRLANVLDAVAAGDTILVCEGEKDVDTAVSLGYVATTNPMGSKKWNASYSQTLKGANIVLIPDQDDAGKVHEKTVIQALIRAGCIVRVVNLPAKDLTEWVEAGGSRAALEALLNVEPVITLEYDAPVTNGTIEDAALLDAQGILDQLREADKPDAGIVWDNLDALAQLPVADWSQFKAGCKAILQGGINLNDLDKARSDTRRKKTGQGSPGEKELPEIHITTDIGAVVDQAQAAIIAQEDTPRLFTRGATLVFIANTKTATAALIRPQESPIIAEASKAYLRERMASGSRFLKYDTKHDDWVAALPPEWVPDTLKARGTWDFPLLEGLLHSPTMRLDGSILATPGYDVATGLFFIPTGVHYPTIPETPTLQDAQNSLEELQEVFINFPFQYEYHCAAALAAVLSLVGRYAINGNIPLFAVSASTRGSGKGKLVDAISVIATGRTAPVWPETIDDEEERKRILTLAMEGDALVLIDNITQPLGSPALDAALTSPTFKDRILGKNTSKEAPLSAVFFATGNNMLYKGDTARRVIPIYLAPTMERPEEREDFLHPNLLRWLKHERPRLVSAALIILRAYHVAGRPKQPSIKQIGSFEEWNDFIRSALVWAGRPDPAAGRLALEAEQDVSYDELLSLLDCWEACWGTEDKAYTLKETVLNIGALCTDKYAQPSKPPNQWDNLRDALGAFDARYDGKTFMPTVVGKRLLQLQGRIIGNRCLERVTPRLATGFPWKVKRLDTEGEKNLQINVGDVGDVGDPSPNAKNPLPAVSARLCKNEKGGGTNEVIQDALPTSPTSPTSSQIDGIRPCLQPGCEGTIHHVGNAWDCDAAGCDAHWKDPEG